MSTLNGVHHIALMTEDIKSQIAFFSDVLGMKLKALYWMHGVDGYYHGFMELNANCSVAFVCSSKSDPIKTEFGVTHSGNPVKPVAPGTMQHLAFSVDTQEELLAMRDRIRSRGVRVMGPLDHGFCQSIYFGGPENLVLEVSTSESAINAEAWIDPEVVEMNGISAEELKQYKNPAAYTNDSGEPVQQPPAGNGMPEYTHMEPEFAASFDLPDEVVTRELSENTPPVQVASAG